VLAAIAVVPLASTAFGLFIGPQGLTISPLVEAFAIPDIGTVIVNTVVVVIGSSLIALLVGCLLAWLNERTDARLGVITDSLPLIPFLLPPIAGAIGWVLLLSPKAGYLNGVIRWVAGVFGLDLSSGPLDIYNIYGLMFVYVLYLVPYTFMLVSGGLRNADASLDEQSRVCGAGRIRTIWQVTFPAIKQSLSGAWLLLMLVGFSVFSIPLIIGTGSNIDILSVKIINLIILNYPPQTAAAIGLSSILVLFVGATWLWQVRILRSDRYSTLAGKGHRLRPIELGRFRWLGQAALLAYGIVAVVLPFIGLALVSLNGYWTTSIKWASLGLHSIVESVFNDRLTSLALVNSLSIGIVGATVGMVAAALLAVFTRRATRRTARVIIDGAVKLPSVFPHIVMGIGFILVFSGPPFNLGGTTLILLMVYLAMYLPQGSVVADTAVSQVGHELSEASSIFGANDGRTFRKIYLPLMLPGLVAGWAFLFAHIVGDLTATALLAGPSNTVVGFRIMEIFTNGSFAELSSLAVVLAVLSSSVVIGALALSRVLGRWRGDGKKSLPSVEITGQ
jgi:ABC-type Fe3+ transport system, permease component